jgi:hypothetical protein
MLEIFKAKSSHCEDDSGRFMQKSQWFEILDKRTESILEIMISEQSV